MPGFESDTIFSGDAVSPQCTGNGAWAPGFLEQAATALSRTELSDWLPRRKEAGRKIK